MGKQYTCLTIEFTLPETYPRASGLDDSTINHLYESTKEKCSQFIGHPVIYEPLCALLKAE